MILNSWDLRRDSIRSKLGVTKNTRHAWDMRFCRNSELLLSLIISSICLWAILIFLITQNSHLKWLNPSFSITINMLWASLICPHQSFSTRNSLQLFSSFSTLNALLHHPLCFVAGIWLIYILRFKRVIRLSHRKVFVTKVDLLEETILLSRCGCCCSSFHELLLDASWELSLRMVAERGSVSRIGRYTYKTCSSIRLWIWIYPPWTLSFDICRISSSRANSDLNSFLRFTSWSWQLSITSLSPWDITFLIRRGNCLFSTLSCDFSCFIFLCLHFNILERKFNYKNSKK